MWTEGPGQTALLDQLQDRNSFIASVVDITTPREWRDDYGRHAGSGSPAIDHRRRHVIPAATVLIVRDDNHAVIPVRAVLHRLVIPLHPEGRWCALNLASLQRCLPELNTESDRVFACVFNLNDNLPESSPPSREWSRSPVASALNHPNICTIHDIGEFNHRRNFPLLGRITRVLHLH